MTNSTNLKYFPSAKIFVDESGHSAYPNTKAFNANSNPRFFIIGFCYCKKPIRLENNLKKLLRRLHQNNQYPHKLKELKFYPTISLRKSGYSHDEIKSDWEPKYDEIRHKVLDILVEKSDGVFAAILNKNCLSDVNYNPIKFNMIFKKSLIYHVLPNLDCSTLHSIIHDHGVIRGKTKPVYDSICHLDPSLTQKISSANSVLTPGIWASDFVAGAFHLALRQKIPQYRDKLAPKFLGNGSAVFEIK